MSNPTLLDLFCGAGGLSLGLQRAGFEPVFGVDFDADSVETLAGHARHDVIRQDVYDFLEDVRAKKIRLPKIYLLAGGPPCQGFCAINPKRHADDPRNSLVDTFLYAVELVKPTFVLMENVTGLLSLAGGRAIKTVEERLHHLGYKTSYRVLQAAHYGVPQSRWRLIVLASKITPPAWPAPTHAASITPNFIRGKELTFPIREGDLFASLLPPVTVGDAIKDLPALENGGSITGPVDYQQDISSEYQRAARQGNQFLYNHATKSLEKINMERVRVLREQGMNWTDLPEHLMPKNLARMQAKYGAGVGAKTRFSRLRWSGLFSTIVTSPDPYWGAFIHPEQDRVISVREAARAQSFPDSVKFEGSLNSQYRQVGNAVPPLLAEAIGASILATS